MSYYFKISSFPIIYNKIPFIRIYIRKWIKSKKNKLLIDYSDCTISPSNIKSQDNVYYNGYFQSCDCFDTIKSNILRTFTLRKKHIKKFTDKYSEVFKKNRTIVIHIRRTDYLDFGNILKFKNQDVSLPISYYKNCLKNIDNLNDYKIFVIGDDYDYAINHFSDLDNVVIDKNEMIVDFQLMINSDVLIMSNSTFAWWGAFLNRKINKRIFAPKYFLGYKEGVEFPNGIYNLTKFEQMN